MTESQKKELSAKDQRAVRGICCLMSAGLMAQAASEFISSDTNQEKVGAIAHLAVATGGLILSLTYNEKNNDEQQTDIEPKDEELGEKQPLLSNKRKTAIEQIIENGTNGVSHQSGYSL